MSSPKTDGDCPTIAERATQCSSLFLKCMMMPGIVPDPSIMDNQLVSFTTWAAEMDVYRPPNVSLDYKLRFSPNNVEIIHRLLDVIYDALTSLKPVDDPPQAPAPSHNLILFDQEIEYQEHVIKEHGAPERHIGTLSEIALRRGVFAKKLECCPFGDDFQHPQESESSEVFSSEALQAHVAAHMEEVALLALQKLPGDGDGKSEKVDGG